MFDAVSLLAAFGCAYLGFALLALAQTQHWQSLQPRESPTVRQRRGLRGTGALALGLALAVLLARDGPAFGTLLWATLMSLAALAAAFTLSWRPGWLRPIVRAAILCR